MKYKLCVWDLDGTLLHTLPTLHHFDNLSLKHFGFNEITYDQNVILIKYPIGEYYHHLLRMGGCEEEKIEGIVNDLIQYNFDLYNADPTCKAEEFEGVRETLIRIQEMGIENVLFSNKFQEISEKLAKHYYKDEISAVYGQLPQYPSKPQVGCTDRILKSTGLSADEILIIGDTEVDILSAKNNHIDCVCATWGYQTRDVLMKYEPDYIIDRPEELLEILRR